MDTSFSSLSHREQVRRMTSLAQTALEACPITATRLRLLTHLWNTTFRVLTETGEQYVLRIHHPGQQSVEAVRSELLWLAALREETRLQVPEPVWNRKQSLVTVTTDPGVPQPRLCVLFHWIEGRFFNHGLTTARLSQVGALMAHLHHHAASWKRPAGFKRHRVDNLFCMEREQDEHFNETIAERAVQLVSDVVTPEAGTLVATAIRRVWAALRDLGEAPEHFGLIHADLHHRNFLFHKNVAGAIDFDDCGFGHRLYDMAVTLSELQSRPDYAALRQGFLSGYRQNRTLSAEHETLLETFLALRSLQNTIGLIEDREQPAFRDWWKRYVTAELQSLHAFLNR
jgi:Ser/Thr protein kinase RdoA (MazF antagonist)